ncbi:hypothetical protein [Chryseobacterium sp. 5_R23647]|uniref:hypothetical protein n=1 Tax=Chryseobacterium sp. 5_R23647 TaxID=2258964 RepID=UPI000E27CE60|nr:hypothetical protein [Chryseobacterium sp. 5_R23647]REC39841.1 hypothetical protein DRF69_21260 [Chryseobacterium sp. 5_R23647]
MTKLKFVQEIAEKHFSQNGLFKVRVIINKNVLLVDIELGALNSISLTRIEWFKEETEKRIIYIKSLHSTYIEILNKENIRISFLIDG